MASIVYTYDLRAYSSRYEFQSLLNIDRAVSEAIKMRRDNPGFLYEMQGQHRIRKNAQEFAEYQNQETVILRNNHDDRVFPMETVAVQQFRTKHDMDIEDVTIHYGPSSDELARSYHALAIAIGTDIFFRNNAYRPETEEGQKLLAHEMTHAAQYREGRITGNTAHDKLEEEAEQSEQKEMYDPDPYVPLAAGNRLYHVRKSKRDKFIKQAADEVERYVREQQYAMEEGQYYRFLRAYEDMLIRGI